MLMSLKLLDTQQAETHYKAGDVIMRQGEVGLCAYYLISGRVAIRVRAGSGRDIAVGTRGAGSIIGEMAIVDDQPRSATVVATEDCSMIEITREDFRRAVASAHPVVRLITQVILSRYRDILGRSPGLSGTDTDQYPEHQERAIAASCNVLDALRMVREFKLAIRRDELILHYQPIVEPGDGRVRGFEALMRWHHPEHGLMPPDAFIPMAEESGLIVEATQWALREACLALSRVEQQQPGKRFFMSVNFSAMDIEHEGFVAAFEKILGETGTDPSQIHLEITERVLIRPQSLVLEVLKYLRNLGVDVVIDDFGTGYSSLCYLHQFPVSTLKVDKAFTQSIGSDEHSLRLIRSILTLSDNMGLKVVAEGVESAAQAKTLQQLGCNLVQGYHFARPMTEAALHQFLGGSNGKYVAGAG